MVHNRLTHSMKAAHIARTIATRNVKWERLHRDVVEAAALAHDLGHPPFGHAGEKALDECVTNAGVEDGFEGNAQTFRILTKLSMSRAGRDGLNLTRRVLNAVLKYPWLRGQPGDRRHDKWSVYRSEEKEFRFARSGSAAEGKNVDTKVMELADDIAYAVHDIEDAVRAEMIPIDELLKEGQQREQFLEFVEQMSEKEGLKLNRAQAEIVLNLFKSCESPLSLKHYENSPEQRGALRRITTILHKRYILAARLGDYEDLQVEERFRTELHVLKYLMRHFVGRLSLLASVRSPSFKAAILFPLLLKCSHFRFDLLRWNAATGPDRIHALFDLTPHLGLPKIITLFQEAESFTDNLAGRFIISNGHFLTDELLHLFRQRNIHASILC